MKLVNKCVFIVGFGFFMARCSEDSAPVFTKDIAPIIYKNCTPCHRPGEAGPFPLISYEDVSRKSKMIAYVTHKNIMPPWPADETYTQFVGQRVLSTEEKTLLKRWADNGAPKGEDHYMPELPNFQRGSQSIKPDLVVPFENAIQIEGNNRDKFLVMKIPFELPNDTFVRVIEFVPGNRKLVHHMNGHLIRYDEGKKKNIFSGERFVDNEFNDNPTVHRLLDLANDDGSYPLLVPSVCNYLPGQEAVNLPEGIGGYTLNRQNAFYLNSIHYGPTAKNESDSSYFNIFFAKEKPKRPISEFQMGTLGVSPVEPPLIIEPGVVKTFSTRLTVKEDISIVGIVPHMHLIGKRFHAYALTPTKDTIRLIRINDWDFRWQYFYKYPTLLKIPSGSTIIAEGVYDNTSNNPYNPYSPPRLITDKNSSMRTTDEMFQLIVLYVRYMQGDENITLTQ